MMLNTSIQILSLLSVPLSMFIGLRGVYKQSVKTKLDDEKELSKMRQDINEVKLIVSRIEKYGCPHSSYCSIKEVRKVD